MSVLFATALVAACGGRSLDARDAAASGDGDAQPDRDAQPDAAIIDCSGGAVDCPFIVPYCCVFSDDWTSRCTSQPDEYLERNQGCGEACWECFERAQPSSMQPVDCVDGGFFHPERCPDGFPHCCVYGQEVCADHVLQGYRCDR